MKELVDTTKDGKPITIRLPIEEEMHYRRAAHARGLTLNAHLHHLLINGVLTESALEIKERMLRLFSVINASERGGGGALNENLALSILTTEEMLKAIVEQRDIQELYSAQDRAKNECRRNKRLMEICPSH